MILIERNSNTISFGQQRAVGAPHGIKHCDHSSFDEGKTHACCRDHRREHTQAAPEPAGAEQAAEHEHAITRIFPMLGRVRSAAEILAGER
jgi:hypothetical protein